MAGFKNAFTKGMDKDTSKQMYSNTQYPHSENLRILTDEGLTTGALENIDGNTELLDFPRVTAIWEFEPSENTGALQQATIDLSDGTSVTLNIPANSTVAEIIAALEVELTNSTNFQNFTWATATSSRLVLYHNTLDITNITGVTGFSKISAGFDSPKVMGSVNLRDTLILFTVNPGVSTSPTQIWKLTYDVTTPRPTGKLTLLYNNHLGMTEETPIEGVSRYENPDIQRVYWTDRTNPIRSINIVDDSLLALAPSQISLSPSINLSQPFASGLTTGSLLSGLYQVVYRASRAGGASGSVSPISAPVAVTGDVIDALGANTSYEIYGQTNTDVATEKGIKFTIPNLDTGFDTLDVYVVRRETGGTYRAFLSPRINLGGESEIEVSITDLNILEEVKLTDVFDFDIDFDRVKTMTIKDNTLVVGNVKESVFDLDFDARAYRFKKSSTTTYVTHNTSISNWGVLPTDNAINPSNNVETESATFIDNYFWKRNSETLGGEGPNVSYEFTNQYSQLNRVDEYNGGSKRPSSYPFTAVPPIDLTINGPAGTGKVYDMQNSYYNFKDGVFQSYFKGYMRDEVYRFGIIFYSKSGKPSPVKWIGDIRMPQNDVSRMLDTSSSSEQSTGYSLGLKFTVDASSIIDDISGYEIVRVPRTQKDKTIVGQGRAGDIGVSNDTVDGTVYFNAMAGELQDTNNSTYVAGDNILPGSGSSSGVELYSGAITFDCPDWKMGTTLIDEGTTDYYIKPVGTYDFPGGSSLGYVKDINSSKIPTTYGSYYVKGTKLRDGFSCTWENSHKFTPSATDFYGKVTNAVKVGEGKVKIPFANPGSAGTLEFYNRGYLAGYLAGSKHAGTTEDLQLANDILMSPGTDTIVLSFERTDAYKRIKGSISNIPGSQWLSYDYVQNSQYRQHIVNLCKVVAKQYGGNTYLERKNNEYISCGSFISTETAGAISSVEVYGGDVYIGLVPMKKLYSENATWTVDATGITSSSAYNDFEFTVQSPVQGVIFPIEGTGNVEMKNGASLNTLVTLTDAEINDGYVLDPVYNLERYFKKFQTEGNTTTNSTEFDNRLYKSDPKINGEALDSWSTFKPLNYLDVDGHNGALNKLTTFNDRLIFLQDSGIGEIAINPREVIQSVDGSSLELGTGSGLVDFKYISDTIGCRHQFSVLKSKLGIYFLDSNLRKYYRLSNGLEPLSDMKGMSSWFYNNLKGSVLTDDNPFYISGVATGYDNRYNEVYITIRNREIDVNTTETINTITWDDTNNVGTYKGTAWIIPDSDTYLTGEFLYLNLELLTEIYDSDISDYLTASDYEGMMINNGNVVDLMDASYDGNFTNFVGSGSGIWTTVPIERFEDVTGVSKRSGGGSGSVSNVRCALIRKEYLPNLSAYLEHLNDSTSGTGLITSRQYVRIQRASTTTNSINTLSDSSTTLVFNETVNAFTSFYSHTPYHYISDGRKIISQDPSGSALYIHDEGNKGEFYGTKYSSKLTLLVNPPGDTTKVFNNVEYLSQVDINGVQEHNETLSSIRVYNEYQDTGVVNLVPDSNVRRRMRTWRLQVPRVGTENARVRNPYTQYDLSYTNEDDKHLILNDVTSYYTDSPM